MNNMANANLSKTISGDKVFAALGITEESLDGFDEVEFEWVGH